MIRMTGNENTCSQLEGGQIENPPGPDAHESVRSLAPTSVTPPPPSAPTEFLASQWLIAWSAPDAHENVEAALTPPPPSAPAEFLSAQWSDGTLTDANIRETEPPDFETAIPASIHSLDQLEELESESVLTDEAMPGDEVEGYEAAALPSRIRGVPLGLDEEITRIFLPNDGLVDRVPRSGQALILTNQRLIAFRGMEGYRDTHMAMASEIAQCSVRTGQRNWNAIAQGLMVMVGGAILYLIVGYWLAGQISGPNVPVLNIDVAPLIALLIVLVGVFILASNYFTRPAGAVIFHGEGMEIAFPFRSSLDVQQVYDLVDLAHSPRRQARNGTPDGEPVN